MIAYQMIERFEFFHSRCIVHRDIKPENFVMGLGDNSGILQVIDMGLAKQYYHKSTNKHIEFKTGKQLTGTPRYASIHSHLGEELSRRDDLESMIYTWIYLYTGALPWENFSVESDEGQSDLHQCKINVSVEEICEDCPSEFNTILQYIKDLTFIDQPDYGGLKTLIQRLATRKHIDLFDKIYDWSVRAITIKDYPQFFDFLDDPELNPFNEQGYLKKELVKDKNL